MYLCYEGQSTWVKCSRARAQWAETGAQQARDMASNLEEPLVTAALTLIVPANVWSRAAAAHPETK